MKDSYIICTVIAHIGCIARSVILSVERRIALSGMLSLLLLSGCVVVDDRPWSVRMVDSEIMRNPSATQLDFAEGLKWSYCVGLECESMLRVGECYNRSDYIDYVLSFADTIVSECGEILTYDISEYNIDMLNSGKFLFDVYALTGDLRYRYAIDNLRYQLFAHPRTFVGGFWHKLRYPSQMWLDGLYMCGPFYAEYCSTFTCAASPSAAGIAADSVNSAAVSGTEVGFSPSSLRSEDPPPKARRLVSEANSNVVPPQSPTRSSTGGATSSVASCADCFNDVTLQYKLIARHTYDSVTGLFRHGYDESRKQAWSDPVTGCSANAWGRALGWYAMSLVDVLDFLPVDHTDRDSILTILHTVADGIVRYQDISSGVWYQVLDSANAPGNYLESSCSCMFVYFLSKSVRLGYLPSSYLAPARVGYAGIIKNFLRDNADGTYSITNCCEVAGLGGSPYRDGSYSYYISEPVRDNDPKSVGPFILASLEFEQ